MLKAAAEEEEVAAPVVGRVQGALPARARAERLLVLPLAVPVRPVPLAQALQALVAKVSTAFLPDPGTPRA